MNLHEYQGKELFAKYDLPVSIGRVISNAEDAVNACRDIGGNKWVIKAQVHAGGRGKAGGVELINSPNEAVAFAQKWLGKRLVTYQTDADGQLVSSILIEECTDIAKELYLSAVIDRGSQRIVFIASSEGCPSCIQLGRRGIVGQLLFHYMSSRIRFALTSSRDL